MTIHRIGDSALVYLGAGASRWDVGAGSVTYPPINSGARLWVGLNGLTDVQRDYVFMDVMKSARAWTGQTGGPYGEGTPLLPPYQDSNGYLTEFPPTVTFVETFFFTNQPLEAAPILNGRYRFLYDGAGTLEIVGGGITNLVATTGQIEFDYAVPAGESGICAIRVNAITLGNHPRNMRLFRTDYAARIASGFVTRPGYEWDDVAVMRMMNYTIDSGLNDVDFTPALRPVESNYTYAWKGVPFEVICKIANEFGASPWICIPHRATDAYVTTMATIIRDNLNPALVARFEWSNEVWNRAVFPVGAYCGAQALAEFGTDAGTDWLEWGAGRAAQCMDIISGVFAGQTNRIYRILGGFQDIPSWTTDQLDAPKWVALGRPAPGLSFDAVAVGGYWNGWEAGSDTDQAALLAEFTANGAVGASAWLMNRLQGPSSVGGSLAELFQNWSSFQAVCASRGLDMVMYEGGTHLLLSGSYQENTALVDFIIDFNYSADMASIYTQALNYWDTVADGGFNAFVTTSGPSKFGSWGAMRWPGDNNPRAVVLGSYNDAPLSQPGDPVGGQTVDTYAHLNSLHNHDAGAGNLNTSTANWLARLAPAAPNGGNTYTCGWQFGFANGWTLPPNAQGQEVVTSPHMSGTSWTGGNQIEVVEFVPDNFEGWTVAPNVPNSLGFTYTTRLLEMIDGWEANAPNANRKYRLYVGWRLLSGYGATTVGDLTAPMIANWISDSLGSYQAWFEDLEAQLQAARPGLDIGRHDVNRALMLTYRDTVVSTIPATSLFEDMAPHGFSTWYFLAAVADYIELFNEKPPAGFVFDGAWGVNATVTANYQAIVDFMWGVLRP